MVSVLKFGHLKYKFTKSLHRDTFSTIDMHATLFQTHSKQGFSLVEVVVALGIVSVSCLTIVGLIPTGMTALQSAITATTSTAIISRVSAEIQQADFSSFSTVNSYTKYYDDQANEVTTNTGSALYKVTVNITPSATLPASYVSQNLAVAVICIQNQKAAASAGLANGYTKAYTVYVANQ